MNIPTKEINLLQQVHSYVHNLKIDVPSITVVGPQSSGKSSVLESLINRDILPRGSNLVTRCPIIIHLKKSLNKEFVEIQNEKIKLTNDNNTVKTKILNLMDQICGTDKEISSNPIVINLWIKNGFEFTIIDLPGITKVAIGKQSLDIENKILNMIREYTKPKNTILLAIINSNVDISNSEALKICKEVDCEFSRTIGVVTKIDLMDKGTNCLEILENKTYFLRLGYVGVINRSQQDIINNINISDFRKKEMDFFRNGVYKHLKNTGSQFLLNLIFSLYQNKVKEIFPSISEELKKKLKNLQGLSYLDPSILRYKYNSALVKLINNESKEIDIFTYSGSNIIFDLNRFKDFKVNYDFSSIKKLIVTDLSIFINDNILKTVISCNMSIIKNKVLEFQNQYKKKLINNILQIISQDFPDTCKAFNNQILKEIESWNIENKISEYIDVLSNVIGNTDLFYKNSCSTNFFGTHLCFRGTSKEEILREYSKMYLDKQIINIIEYVIKYNYFMIKNLIDKTAMICICKINIDESEDVKRYIKENAARNEDIQNILKALEILENL